MSVLQAHPLHDELHSWNTFLTELNVTISAGYTPAPGEDPVELRPNEFTAGSALSLECIVQGDSGDITYTWSVMGNPPTPGCTSCPTASSTTSTLTVGSPLYSYRAGVYTCTVSESGRPDSDNSDDFTVKVVGERVCTVLSIVTCMNNHPGAGIFGGRRTSSSESERRPIANNGLIVSGSDGLRLDCISNSSQSGVGMITGLDGNTLPIGITGVWRVLNASSRPGVLSLLTISPSSLPAADKGIYTCIIPGNNGNQITINVGLYPSGFMSKCQMNLSVCTICKYMT